MIIELNPLDGLSRKIYDSYKEGADKRSKNTQPCSICNKTEYEEGMVRGHFHGSNLPQCMLRVYNNMIQGKEDPEAKPVDIDRRASFLLDGHAHEQQIFMNLSASGLTVIGFENLERFEKKVTVYVKDNDGELQFTMPRYGEPAKGFKKGFDIILHLDGLLEVKNKKTKEELTVGIECKSVSEYTWKKIRKTSEISDEWYGQIQSYMLWNQHINTFYLIVKHRGTSDILRPIKIDRDDIFIHKRLLILHRIYNAILEDNPKKYNISKEHTSIKHSECKFCDYNKDCFGKLSLDDLKTNKENEDEQEYQF